MHTSALEEATLTQDANRQEPPPEEAPEQETAAVVPAEPDVIEGEVVIIEQPEPSEDQRAQKQKPYWLGIPCTVLACLLFLAGSYLLPLFTPTATITIIPIERTITTTATIQAHAREVAPLTLSQSATIPATGIMHQKAARAKGTITFYNGLLTSQYVAAGIVLTGSDGVQIETDLPATIPAATPPIEGYITVSAHAVSTGVSGNIQAYDINTACCLTSVLAKNTHAFTGGQDARAYRVVTQSDIGSAEQTLSDSLTTSEQAAVTTQVHPGEALIPTPCTFHSASDHKPGDEVKQVTVTVSDTCGGIAYAAHDVYAIATQMIQDAANQLGTGYSPVGDIQTTILQVTTITTRQGQAQMIVQATGTYTYQITPRIQEQLARLIAGKPQQQAEALLLKFPGIAEVQITVRGGNQTLPLDAKAIRILVRYNAGQTQSTSVSP